MPNHRRNNKKKNKKKHGSKNRRARKQQNKKTYPNDLNGYVLHPNVPPQKWKQTIEKDGETLYPLPPNYFIKGLSRLTQYTANSQINNQSQQYRSMANHY